jgi:hypothetical protein
MKSKNKRKKRFNQKKKNWKMDLKKKLFNIVIKLDIADYL